MLHGKEKEKKKHQKKNVIQTHDRLNAVIVKASNFSPRAGFCTRITAIPLNTENQRPPWFVFLGPIILILCILRMLGREGGWVTMLSNSVTK